METIPGLDRKRLAERMGVTPGTVTKKLAAPHRIDQEWLSMFAEALDRDDFRDLYRHPDQPTRDELLNGLSDEQLREVTDFASFVRQRSAS